MSAACRVRTSLKVSTTAFFLASLVRPLFGKHFCGSRTLFFAIHTRATQETATTRYANGLIALWAQRPIVFNTLNGSQSYTKKGIAPNKLVLAIDSYEPCHMETEDAVLWVCDVPVLIRLIVRWYEASEFSTQDGKTVWEFIHRYSDVLYRYRCVLDRGYVLETYWL
jgi:hypothetical protein